MYKTFGKIVIAALIGLLGLFSYGVLVDTEGNAVTNQTLLGDIDMGIGTAGDLKQFVITNGNDSVSSNFVRKSDAVMWHDNVQSNITAGNISSIGYGSISFSDIDGNYYIGDYSIALGYRNDAGNFSSVFGIDSYVGDFSLGFGNLIFIGGYSASIGQYNGSGDFSYLFGYNNYARGNEDGYPYGDSKVLAFMMGVGNWTETDGSFLMGVGHHVGPYAQASLSFGTETAALHPGAFIWNFFPTNYFEMSVDDIMLLPKYNSHGIGSFNINPIGGLDGFWVGETNLSEHIDAKIVPYAIELINQLENGTIIPYKTDNLRTDDGDTAYTATQLIEKSTNAANYAVSELVRTNSVLSNGPYLPLSGGDMTGDINTSSGVRFDYYSNTGMTVYAYSPMSLVFEVPGQSMNFGAVLELGDMQEGFLYTIAFKEEVDSVSESKRDKGDLELYVYSPWYCTNLGMPLEWNDSLNGWSLQSGNNYFLQYDYVTEEWQLYVNGMVESTLLGSPTDMTIYMSYAGMDYEFYRMNIYEPSSDRIAKVSDVDSALSDFASTNSVLANGPYLTQHQSLSPATNYTNWALNRMAETNAVLSNGPYLPLSGGDMTGDINTSSGVRFDYYSNTGMTVYAYSPMSLVFEVPGQSMNFGAVLELGDMQEGFLYTIAFKEEVDSVSESKRDKGDLELYVYSPWYCTNLGMPLEWNDSLNGWSLQSGNNYFLQYDYVTEEWQLYVNGMVESTLLGSPTDMTIYMSYAGMDYEFYRMNIYEPSSDRIAKVSDVDSALSDFASTNSVLANGPYLTQHQSLQPATNYTDSATNALETTIENMDTSYYRFTGITNVNQSVQYVHLNSSQTTLSIEKPISGTTKDWIVYVVAETNVTVNLPPGNFWCTTETVTNDIPQLTPTAFYFSQITEDTFCLGRQELTTIITIQSRDMKKGDRIKEVLNDKKKTRK